MAKQCKKCPWLKDTNPHDIPDGYCETKHRALTSTVTKPGELNLGTLRLMACHETPIGKERPCVGWIANQLGPGNNIGLRLAVLRGRIDGSFQLIGEQHETLEETFP